MSQTNQVQDASQKVTLHRPYSITKAMVGLFKYNENRLIRSCVKVVGHLKTVYFLARA